MAHLRKQIRDALVATFTGLPTTGANVSGKPFYGLSDIELPALFVASSNEQVDVSTIGFPALLERRLNLEVLIKVKSDTTVFDTLDQIIAEVETKIYQSPAINTLGGLVKETNLTAIHIDTNMEGDRPVGQAVLVFEVNYRTAANAPTIAV